MLSYRHGTLEPRNETQTPSYANGSGVWLAVSIPTSTRHMVSVPDYLGYGASKALLHSYEHAASLTSASTGMLRATREFCQQQRVSINGENFLLGYFEGGYAIKALHKLLRKNTLSTYPLRPALGPTTNQTLPATSLGLRGRSILNSYMWMLRTYNHIYA